MNYVVMFGIFIMVAITIKDGLLELFITDGAINEWISNIDLYINNYEIMIYLIVSII